ncbi:hypothetical protein GQ600_18237 [Phytophthora cactorum]|nr:hypothetical protein GQ600_18237 [Phytophthora cactorum]
MNEEAASEPPSAQHPPVILPPTDLPATVPASLDQETPCKLQEVYFIDQPPQLEYAAADAAETSIHEWTKPHNSNVSRNQLSRNDKGEVCYRLFECDYAGKPKNTRKLKTSDRQRLMVGSKRAGVACVSV